MNVKFAYSVGLCSLILAANSATSAPDSEAMSHPPHGGEMMLQSMDSNQDGVITRAEFNLFNSKRFKQLDLNKDGKITAAEMAQRHAHSDPHSTDPHHADQHHAMPFGHPPTQQPAQTGTTHLEERFHAADANQDGGLDRAEAANMPMLSVYFQQVDSNQDGKVTQQEYFDAMPLLHGAKIPHADAAPQ
jgi:Ca2+-binding EF-hand superfamily protein